MPRALILTFLFAAAAAHAQCTDGALGNGTPESFAPLSAFDVNAIVQTADSAFAGTTATIAVVDRAGRVLALLHQSNYKPGNDDLAVGAARTAAFFSHNMAPLTSRTVRFISGVHFPPGVVNAPNAALYGIENTNRGCDLNTPFNPGKSVPPARSLNGNPCNAFDSSGCGPGIVTGKQQPDDGPYPQTVDDRPVNAGGIPLYRILDTSGHEGVISDGKLIGGIGVAGIDDPDVAEAVAAQGAFGAEFSADGPVVPVPQYPLPFPGNVFIDGIRLPFLGPSQQLRFGDFGLPDGINNPALYPSHPSGTGTYVIAPTAGGCADNEYLAGPIAGSQLSAADVDGIVQRAVAAAKKTRGIIRLPLSSYARMVIAVADLNGKILALYRMPDATVFSIDVAVAKARNVIWFSSAGTADLGLPSGTAVTNRTIGFGAQPLYPPGIDSKVFHVGTGPFYPLFLHDLANPCSQGSQPANANQSGIVFFPGATPLYSGGKLVGGLGISGDGVEQDDYVTYLAAGSFLPDKKIWADRQTVNKVRLPMFKFPRQPEGVTECGGKPCS